MARFSYILSLALMICLSGGKTFGADQNTAEFGFPPMADHYLNRILIAALKDMSCTVGSHSGVQGDDRHQKEAPRSCHNIRRAIDINSLHCQNDASNDANLRTLASYFYANPFILICYRDIGPLFTGCKGDHGGHLHFGGRQGLGCRNPFPY